MRTKLFAALAAVTVAGLGSASAADMRMPVKAPPLIAPAFSWTGCYIGANVGGKWANTSGSSVNPVPVTSGGVTSTGFALPIGQDNVSTVIGGGQIGCNWQAGAWVFGIEGDGDGQSWRTSTTATALTIAPATAAGAPLFVTGDSFDIRSRWQASVRGRIGYAWDRLLLYGTGGVGFTDVRVNSLWIPVTAGGIAFPGTVASDSKTITGATAGGGLEYAFLNNVSLGIEGRYTWFDRQTFNSGLVAAIFNPNTGFVFTPTSTSVKLNTWEVIAKLNWKFWSP